jgi:translation initiation factor IF-3
MKTEKEINEKISELAKQLIGTEGSQAHGIRKQIEALKWVLDE